MKGHCTGERSLSFGAVARVPGTVTVCGISAIFRAAAHVAYMPWLCIDDDDDGNAAGVGDAEDGTDAAAVDGGSGGISGGTELTDSGDAAADVAGVGES